jgi:hypothetical protein
MVYSSFFTLSLAAVLTFDGFCGKEIEEIKALT